MKIIIVLLILLITYFDWSHQAQNGVKVRVSKAGLLFGANLGVDLLANKVSTLKIPDFSESKTLLSYGVNNIKITKFVKPTAVVAPVAGVGITAALNNAAIEMTLNWNYKIGKGWFSVKDSGSGSVKTSSISISTTLNIGRDANGKPTASAISCTCSISGFNININGGLISSVYNLIINWFESKIRKIVQDSICDNVKKVINEDGKNQLSTLNTAIKIDSQILLDYKLTANTVFTSEYIETTHAGEFYTATGIRYTNIDPPTNMVISNGKMANIAMAEHLFNSGGYVLQRLGRLNQIFPINDNSVGLLLNQPAGTKLQLKVEVTEAPFIKINTTSFMINAAADVKVQKLDGINVVNVKLALLLSCDINFSGDRIKGQVLSIIPKIIINNNNALNLSSEQLTAILSGLMQLAIPSINLKGAEGFPIPTLSNLKLVSPVLQRAVGYTIVGTDLQRA